MIKKIKSLLSFRLSGHQTAIAGCLVAIFFFLGVSWLFVEAYNDVLIKRNARKDLFENIILLERFFSHLSDVESGQRGYILTSDEEYLVPYNNSLDLVDDDLRLLKQRYRNNPERSRELAHLEELTLAKVKEMRTSVGLVKQGRLAESIEWVNTDVGRNQMSQIRAMMSGIRREEEKKLDALDIELEKKVRRSQMVMLFGGLLALVLLVIIMSFLSREIRTREETELQLQKLNDELESIVEKRTAELHREQEALKAAHAQTAAIIDASMDALITIDVDSKVVEWNAAAERVLGYSHKEAMGRDVSELIIPPKFRQAHFRGMHHYLETGEGPILNRRVEMVAIDKNGREFPVELSIHRVPVEDKLLFSATLRDIEELVAAREYRAKINAELEKRVEERTAQLTALNKELEAFSYSVSHDLRAPLRSISGFGQALQEMYADSLDEEGRDYLVRIINNTKRMGQLIDEMLKLSRLTRGEVVKEDIDLGAMAREIADDLQTQDLQRKVDFVIAENAHVQGDKRLLEAVLQNLMGNAWKFTSHHENARIEFGKTAIDGETVYYVKDDGAGFEMEYVDKLFGAFQRLHGMEEFSGTGIGLATVQRIIHRHGGKIWAEGKPEQGATFYFTLNQEGYTDGQ